MDKIEKLLESDSWEDNYIGLRLFNDLGRGLKIKILRKIFARNSQIKNSLYSWDLTKVYREVPAHINLRYIEGKHYNYLIHEAGIMIDTPKITQRVKEEFSKTDEYTTIEYWK